ncbi:hypothetical protein BDV23DRAFT_190614 [Aspergillus alliaceus]|uniref:Zn(2)-C6 fungal-type domain-containing protein n=1 Tax=Petromyces alliaceus TaxID=209559 RepID=A0A5N7BVW9_PETAA|nr:hypothetical protein BDV23DRAFT_190614 [Aspergillus alliaceus]
MEATSPATSVPSVPVACLNCRDKHLKCDGNMGGCSRCKALNLFCHFVPSRRGRRVRPGPYLTPMTDCSPQLGNHFTETLRSDSSNIVHQMNGGCPSQESGQIDGHMVTLYYLHFHQAHPFLAPQENFMQSSPPAYLMELVQFISLHYLPADYVPDQTSRLRATLQDADLTLEKVQAFLLLSLILHARTQPQDAKGCLAQAISCSLELGLQYREYSAAIEEQDPIRAESARRTWWEIFIVDTLLAAVQVHGSLQLMIDPPDVPLPCEMDDYQDGLLGSGTSSICEMDRQTYFHRDGDFSSLAYRVQAACILRKCLLAGQSHFSQDRIDALDATISAWFHRLPKRKRAVLYSHGDLDKMIFQATMIIHCASLYLHFPKSYLLVFLPVSSQVFCARPPNLVSVSENPHIHTAKVASAAVHLSKLASLSTSVLDHSPFYVCTLVLSSIIQLAMLSVDPDEGSRTGRQYLSLNLGVLRSMGDIWPIAAISMARIQEVAVELETSLATQRSQLSPDPLSKPGLIDFPELNLPII